MIGRKNQSSGTSEIKRNQQDMIFLFSSSILARPAHWCGFGT
jgi:hypothetical protein